MTNKAKKPDPIYAHRLRGKDGFTLIELMIAAFILTVGVAALIYSITFSLQKSREPHDRSVAMDLAQQKLEELRNEDYATVAGGQDLDSLGQPTSIDPYGQPGGLFTRVWVVEDDVPMTGTKTVTVMVSWEIPAGSTVQITTIIARPFPEGGG